MKVVSKNGSFAPWLPAQTSHRPFSRQQVRIAPLMRAASQGNSRLRLVPLLLSVHKFHLRLRLVFIAWLYGAETESFGTSKASQVLAVFLWRDHGPGYGRLFTPPEPSGGRIFSLNQSTLPQHRFHRAVHQQIRQRLRRLVQSGTAMLSQANSLPQSVLKLLG